MLYAMLRLLPAQVALGRFNSSPHFIGQVLYVGQADEYNHLSADMHDVGIEQDDDEKTDGEL